MSMSANEMRSNCSTVDS